MFALFSSLWAPWRRPDAPPVAYDFDRDLEDADGDDASDNGSGSGSGGGDERVVAVPVAERAFFVDRYMVDRYVFHARNARMTDAALGQATAASGGDGAAPVVYASQWYLCAHVTSPVLRTVNAALRQARFEPSGQDFDAATGLDVYALSADEAAFLCQQQQQDGVADDDDGWRLLPMWAWCVYMTAAAAAAHSTQ